MENFCDSDAEAADGDVVYVFHFDRVFFSNRQLLNNFHENILVTKTHNFSTPRNNHQAVRSQQTLMYFRIYLFYWTFLAFRQN